MVEVWPYMERSRGIAAFQLWGRLAGFFTTFVNPIGLDNVGWRYLISYCCWLAFEVVFVYFMFPETFGRTLEELAFSMFIPARRLGRVVYVCDLCLLTRYSSIRGQESRGPGRCCCRKGG